MWKTKIVTILIILIFLGLVFETSYFLPGKKAIASQVYLPKADLIKGTGPEVYILENGVRRWIPNPETFEYFSYKWTNIKHISNNLLNSYVQGNDLKKYNRYPDGSLLKGTGPEVYLIELGKRRWIPTPRTFEGNNFGWSYVIEIDDWKLKRISQGDNLSLAEANRYPETLIIGGPAEGEILEKGEITFKFSGTNPLGPAKDLTFEAFLVGYDNRWRRQHSDEKTYKLEENKVYTLYVRAKNKQGYFDSRPARRRFQVGISPYYQKVEISRVRAKERNFQRDYLILRSKDKDLIDISGWIIETRAETIIIPQAVAKLGHPFSKENYTDIKLNYRGEVIISMGLAPQGVNFQTNKCTGYLDQLSRFYPSLKKDCPRLDESEYRHLAGACRDFIKRLPRCQVPDYSEKPKVSSDSQCTNFLREKFNYKQCYEDYYQEIDFFKDKWRVFLNKSIDILDNDGDIIVLRDRSGLVVDEHEY